MMHSSTAQWGAAEWNQYVWRGVQSHKDDDDDANFDPLIGRWHFDEKAFRLMGLDAP